jgi:hypothetical protein
MDGLTNLMVTLISQYMHVSKHHVIYLKYTILLVNYISIKLEREKKNFLYFTSYLFVFVSFFFLFTVVQIIWTDF